MASPRSSRNGNRPSTRRNKAVEEDYRPVGADGSKPPMLDLHLARKLKILALANALPLVAGIIIFLAWAMGSIEFSMDGNLLLFAIMIILCCLVLVGSCWWVLFPFSVWLRAYPTWYYQHDSKLVWALPCAAAWITWFILWIACITITLFSLFLIGKVVIYLLGHLDSAEAAAFLL